MAAVRAIFEQGVFRPLEAVDLPDKTAVEFEPRVIAKPSPSSLVYEILLRTFDAGETDLAERHNEHQP